MQSYAITYQKMAPTKFLRIFFDECFRYRLRHVATLLQEIPESQRKIAGYMLVWLTREMSIKFLL